MIAGRSFTSGSWKQQVASYFNRKRNLATVCRDIVLVCVCVWSQCHSHTVSLYGVALCCSNMALLMSSLLPRCKVPLSRARADFQGVGVRFKHALSPGSPLTVRKPAVGLSRTRSPATAEKFSTTARSEALWRSAAAGSTCSVSPGKTSGLLGRVVLGVAAGVSSVAVVQTLHTGSLSAMARRVNLESAEGNWKETKGEAVQPRPGVKLSSEL